MKTFIVLALLFASIGPAAAAPAARPFVVIVNAANAVTLTRGDIVDIFLKRITRWQPDNVPIVVVDAPAESPVREAFSHALMRRGVEAVEAYWQQQIFSGRDVPPVVKETDADVVAFVRSNPGAIGYVARGAALEGVRVVVLDK